MGNGIRRSSVAAVVAVCAATALAPASASAAAPGPFGPATRIVLERTGGFAGVHDSFVVDRTTVGGKKPLRAAGTGAFRRLRGSYQPKNPCCDRFAYRVIVSYHGSRKTVSTMQGAPAPRILWEVIGETERLGS